VVVVVVSVCVVELEGSFVVDAFVAVLEGSSKVAVVDPRAA